MVLNIVIVFECIDYFSSKRVMTAISEVNVTESLKQLDSS